MSLTYLLWANVLVWIGIGGYLVLLSGRQRGLQERIEQLETDQHDRVHGN